MIQVRCSVSIFFLALASACCRSTTPPVAISVYREHLWYDVYTRPDTYFSRGSDAEKIRVLAIGDSWFAYPKEFGFLDPLFGGRSNILTNLVDSRYQPRMSVLSLSNSGEIVANMAGLAQEDPIDAVESIQIEVSIPWVVTRSLARAEKPFDYVVISGGGNDILSPGRIEGLLKHRTCPDGADVLAKCVDETLLRRYVDKVGDDYRTLIRLITDQPRYGAIKIFAHTYDYMIPSTQGAVFVGGLYRKGEYGWVYPYFDTYNVRDERAQRVIHRVLGALKDELDEVQRQFPNNFVVVNTQGTLEHEAARRGIAVRDLWLNEIHPTPDGYRCIAEKVRHAIVADMKSRPGGQAIVDSGYTCVD